MRSVRKAVLFAVYAFTVTSWAHALALGDAAPPLEVAAWHRGEAVQVGAGDCVYVVEFWADWCPPCRESVPALNALQERCADKGLVVIGVCDQDAAEVAAFEQELGAAIGYRIAQDKQEATWSAYAAPFGVESIPHAFVVDKAGRLVWHGHPGEGLDEVVDAVLAGTYDLSAAVCQAQSAGVSVDREDQAGALLACLNALAGHPGERELATVIGEHVLGLLEDRVDALDAAAYAIAKEDCAAPELLEFALRTIQRAAELEPENASVQDTYGYVLYRLGRREEAMEHAERAVSLSEDGSGARGAYAERYFEYRTSAKEPSVDGGLGLGDGAPPLEVAAWHRGEAVELGQGNRPCVLSFWGASDPDCPDLVRALNALQGRFTDQGVVFVGICDQGLEEVGVFERELGEAIDYRVAQDDHERTWHAYRGLAGYFPWVFLVDGMGRLVWHGGSTEGLEEALRAVLDGSYDLESAIAAAQAAQAEDALLACFHRLAELPEGELLSRIGERLAALYGGRVEKLDVLAWDAAHVESAAPELLEFALRTIQRAEELEPENASVQDTCGYALHRLGRDQEAMEHAERAVLLSEEGLAERAAYAERWFDYRKAAAEGAGGAQTEEAGEARTVDLGNGGMLELVWVPPGEFLMGSPEGEEDRYDDEGPQHRVRIPRGFWMGRYEVTQGQWEAVMGGNPSYFRGDATLPVEQVSWEDCQAFLHALNGRVSGGGFRLPTEAEWEYACRAGATMRFSFGDEEGRLVEQAWYDGNGDGRTHPVGGREPNAWGLYDLHGNVWEWCEDDWHDDYDGAPSDGSAWVDAPRGSDRVYRGGSWDDDPRCCRSAFRLRGTPGFRYDFLGFRVVLPAVQ